MPSDIRLRLIRLIRNCARKRCDACTAPRDSMPPCDVGHSRRLAWKARQRPFFSGTASKARKNLRQNLYAVVAAKELYCFYFAPKSGLPRLVGALKDFFCLSLCCKSRGINMQKQGFGDGVGLGGGGGMELGWVGVGGLGWGQGARGKHMGVQKGGV